MCLLSFSFFYCVHFIQWSQCHYYPIAQRTAVVVTGKWAGGSLQFCAKVKERLYVRRIKKAARPKKAPNWILSGNGRQKTLADTYYDHWAISYIFSRTPMQVATAFFSAVAVTLITHMYISQHRNEANHVRFQQKSLQR